MKEYIALKKFHLGELTTDIMKDERIRFDGTNAIIRGEEVKAPSLMRVVGTLIQEAVMDSAGKLIEQTTPVNIETPQQRAARMKQERLLKLRGSAGNGEFLEDHEISARANAKVSPRKTANETPVKDQDAKIIQRDKIDVKTNQDQRLAKKAEELAKSEKNSKPREIINENEGVEVAKIKNGTFTEDLDPKSFYNSLLDGETKKLEVAKDQYVAKKPVIKMDSQDDAVELKKLVTADEITPAVDPLKDWSSMTARKKENFIKKATDTAVIKKIVERETGSVKRKAEERLANLDGSKGL